MTAEDHFRSIVDRSLNVVALLDADAELIFVNATAERILGWPPAEITSRPVLDFVHPGDHGTVREEFRRVVADDAEPRLIECRLLGADGAWRPFDVHASRITHPDGTQGLQVSARDASDRHRAEREIRELSARLQAVLDALPVGIAFEDEHRLTCTINPALCAVFGVPGDPGALLGATSLDGIRKAATHLADPEGFLARIDDLVAAGRPAYYDELEFADGRIASRHYVPVRDAEGQLGHAWLYRDITAERRAEAQLRAMRDDAVAAARSKEDFVATMSHEIRTPLNGMLGAAEILASTDLAPGQRELVALLSDAGAGLRAIIDDILDFSRIEAGKLPIRERRFAVRDLVGGARDVLAPAVMDRDVELGATVDATVPPELLGDPDRLRQILLNLAGNAVKFTEQGAVSIHAGVGIRRAGSVELVLSVSDTGPGIAAAERDRLFQPFTQVDASAARTHGGTGLGLAITRRLVELMGGDLELDSTPGEGSTFRVRVPLRTADGVEHGPEARPDPAGAEPLNGHVLLADDNDLNRRVLTRQLERLGLAVTAVAGGREAIRAAAGTPFDAILMDCRMPGVDGYTAARAIRAQAAPSASRVPIIAITANALPEDRERCRASGMDDVVTKPVALGELRDTLASAMPPGALDVRVLERLREELDDDELLASVVQSYAGALDGRRAALHAAHADADAERLAEAAHVLAAPSATIGLVRLGERCRELEGSASGPGAQAALDAVEAELERAAPALQRLLGRFRVAA